MKKFLAVLPLFMLIISCGGNSDESTSANATNDSTTAEQPAANDISSNPDYQKGLALIAKSNCLTCHKVDEKLIGPAYRDVAKKYAGSDTAVTYLAHKVISGGKGVWGDVVMTPHPDINEADAEQMVKYILLLNQ
jgi:cytochrome c